METLAQDVLGLTVHRVHVVCPRCRQLGPLLKHVRNQALQEKSCSCHRWCTLSASAGPGITHEGVAHGEELIGVDDEVDDDEGGDDLEASLDMGTLGFATWIVGLGKAPKKRLHVVEQAIAAAQQAKAAMTATVQFSEKPAVGVSEVVAVVRAQVEHACRLVER